MLTVSIVAAVVSVACGGLGVAAFVASSPRARGPKPHRPQHAMRRGDHVLDVATKELAEATATIEELRKDLATKGEQIERQADLFDEYRTEIAKLRRHIADADNSAARDSAKDPDARPQCPEGLLVDGCVLHRCVRDGGHEGNHWSRDREREWEPVPVDESVVPPW